jgi:hypothetical protein
MSNAGVRRVALQRSSRLRYLGTVARPLVVLVAAVGLALLAPANAGPARNNDLPPTIKYAIQGIRGTNGWYRGSRSGNHVILRWTVRDPQAAVIFTSGCENEIIDGPDSGSTRTCMAASDNGVNSVTTRLIRIDADPPVGVVGNASRAPDYNGWYNHPVTVRWSGDDPTSGIASCTARTYGGPDRARAILIGGCSDVAGNRSSLSRFVLRYDHTPPRLGAVVVRSSKRVVRLRWNASRGAHFIVTRSPGAGGASQSVVYEGTRSRITDRSVQSGVSYRYMLRAIDRAGNSAAKTVRAIARAPLISPAAGVRLRSPRSIVFAWDAVPETRYYNLQLWFHGEKILSAWPSLARLRLVAPWTYGGIRRYWRSGRYTWYVWPARGPRSLGVYGSLLGSSTFAVTR